MLAMRIWLDAFAETVVEERGACDAISDESPARLGLLCIMLLAENVGVRPLSLESCRKPEELPMDWLAA